ncbi:kynurenine formamidase [Rubricella aquisinus]|uniref:Kynurenine formamidase n=1 Tax=Rubricella aquisinus TaxID=2028108 RepID=A0A840WYA8_9RHOB|nr:cyclase family protein [Rubricella aquisinus]MBB5514656.1 kynurenine formamidase [Rubricella aquisinus]
MPIIDLTQTIEHGMVGFRLMDANGVPTDFTATVEPFLTHAQSAPNYAPGTSFEVSQVSFQTNIGTYLDAPSARFEGAADIADIDLSSLILDGIVIDARHCTPDAPLTVDALPPADQLTGRAVLICFGWDKHWGTPAYKVLPYVDRDALAYLHEAGIALFGVDTQNADSPNDPERPAHTWFLGDGIHVVENLTGLAALLGLRFRFFAIPTKVRGAVAFPIRAFAEAD